MAGYGVELVGSNVFGDHVVRVEKDSRVVVYERATNGELVVSRTIYSASRIIPIPLYPVNIPMLFTTYILVVFKKPLDLAPKESVTLYTTIPVDIAVYAVKNNEKNEAINVVDVFSVKKVKYGLYGPVDKGVVARYYVSDYYFKEVDPSLGEALVKISAKNKTQEWVSVTRILLESNPLKLYYVEGEWKAYTQELSYIVSSRKTASVYYGRPFKKDVKPIIDPPHLRQPVIHIKTNMIWGI